MSMTTKCPVSDAVEVMEAGVVAVTTMMTMVTTTAATPLSLLCHTRAVAVAVAVQRRRLWKAQ